MRLIDADALIGALNRGLWGKEWDKALCKAIIHDAPTIDAVEVVRCKDCRHAHECHKSVQYTRNEPNTVTIGYTKIDFCSYGERKEGE